MQRLAMLLLALTSLSSLVRSQWTQVTAIGSGECYAVISAGDTVWAALGNTVHVSTDGGSHWSALPSVGDTETVISALARTPGLLVAGTISNGVYAYRENSGWTSRSGGLSDLGASDISAFAVRDTHLYVGTYGAGIYRTGQSLAADWLPFRDGMPWNYAWNIFSLANISGTLFAGGGLNAFVYLNTLPALDWKEVQFAAFSQAGTAFLGAIGYGGAVHAAGSQALHRSTDGGETWKTFDVGLGTLNAGGFATTRDKLYAFLSKVTGTTLYRLTDDDSTWALVTSTSGLVTAVASSASAMFAGKFDGLWRYDIPVAVEASSPTAERERFILEQNFPNPFNPTTTISFQVPVAGNVRLAIHDALGHVVTVPVDEWKSPGRYSLRFDATGLASGVYFCQLKANGFVDTRRMVLTR